VSSSNAEARPRRIVIWGGAALLLLIGGGVGLVVAEIAVRVFGPRETSYYIWPAGTHRELAADPRAFPGVSGVARFTTTRVGLRGPELPADSSTVRVLVLGGSTTENLYLDDTETWTARLQQGLDPLTDGRRLWVGSAGRSGMNSRDHVVQLGRLLDQLPAIDLVVALVGVNDMTVTLAQGDTFKAPPSLADPGARAAAEARAFAIVPGALHQAITNARTGTWYERLALWQLAARLRADLRRRGTAVGLEQDPRGAAFRRWRAYRRAATTLRDSLPDLSVALAGYGRNLDSLAALAASRNVPIVLLTQPSIWRDDLDSVSTGLLWFGGMGDFQRGQTSTYFSVSALARTMDSFNRELLRSCSRSGARCLDLAPLVPRDTLHFYDDVHFNEAGAAAVGAALAPWLRDSVIPSLTVRRR
jgi:lysophospholipase L1-like esterase